MEIMLAVSVLIASLGWSYSAVHTHVHTQRERNYKSLWEGMMEAAGQLAQEKADVKGELEIADDNYKMAIAQLKRTADELDNLTNRVVRYQKPIAPEDIPTSEPTQPWVDYPVVQDDPDGLWTFAEANRDLMPTWELLRGDGIASMQPHRRYSEWATFCANLPNGDLSRGALEDAIEALG